VALTVRVDHAGPVPGSVVWGGRRPHREDDGSFLATGEESQYLRNDPGIRVVE
jgi:hypothetical protein